MNKGKQLRDIEGKKGDPFGPVWGDRFADAVKAVMTFRMCEADGAPGDELAGISSDMTAQRSLASKLGSLARLLAMRRASSRVSALAIQASRLFSEIDATDLATLMAALPSYALPGAAWFGSAVCFALVFARLAGSNGGLGKINSRPSFWNFPFYATPALPTAQTSLTGQVMLAFGNLAQAAVLGERRGVTMARSTHRYLDTDQVAYRGTERIDIVVHDLGDNSTAGPVVGLIGA